MTELTCVSSVRTAQQARGNGAFEVMVPTFVCYFAIFL